MTLEEHLLRPLFLTNRFTKLNNQKKSSKNRFNQERQQSTKSELQNYL